MELETLRSGIDEIDTSITELFCRRMGFAADIARLKKEQNMPMYSGEREREILSRISEEAGPELGSYARILYASLLELSRSYQTRQTAGKSALGEEIRQAMERTSKTFPKEAVVACQGMPGANSQIACDKLFSFANITYLRHFDGVFQAVEKGLCAYGVLPVENSSHGTVSSVYDLMARHRFYIVRSIKLHIHHCLLVNPGSDLSQIREVISHEQAIGQCSRFFAEHPEIRTTICENTAVAAQQVAASGRTDLAAIASEDCARLYGLSIADKEVQDTPNNYTRFFVISKNMEIYPGADRLSIQFSVSNTPGALARLIARFSATGLNMTKLESRPISGTDFQYRFYVDVDAEAADEDVQSLLGELAEDTPDFVFLGCYKEI